MGGTSSRVLWRLLSACALLTLCAASSRMPEGVEVRFRITHIDQVGDAGASSSVGVNGIILVPDRCRVDARIERDSAVLLLRIQAPLSSGHDGACDTGGEITVMQYTADSHSSQRDRKYGCSTA
jgi:hypothetical protein